MSFLPAPVAANVNIPETVQAGNAAELVAALTAARDRVLATNPNAEFLGFDMSGGGAGQQFVATIMYQQVGAGNLLLSNVSFGGAEGTDRQSLQAAIQRANNAAGALVDLAFQEHAEGGLGGSMVWIGVYAVPPAP